MKYVLGIYVPGLVWGGFCFALAIIHGYWPFVIAAWVLMSGLGIAVGFHRVYSHKTHDLRPWLDYLILACGTLAGQGSSASWQAVHIGYHHRFSDREKDLHSPTHGMAQAFMGWYLDINEHTVNHAYAARLLRKKHHMWVHVHYFKIIFTFVAVMAALSYVTGLPFVQVYLAALFISLLQDNLVNVLCHQPSLGYRNWRLNDNSTNFWPLGLFGWGQGWHENHHAFPAKFSFRHNWWEFDPCVLFLPLLWLGSYRRESHRRKV